MKKVDFQTFLGALVLTVGSIALVRSTAAQGTDFEVFWKAAHHLLTGDSIYSLTRDGGMVFKYPPWIAPFFLPFALFPLDFAKWIWGGIEILSLILMVQWLSLRFPIPKFPAWCLIVSFWGLWMVHALDGQIALPMLTLSLYAWSKRRTSLLAIVLSTKIFTLFPLLGFRFNRKFLISLTISFGMMMALSLPALWVEPHHSVTNMVHNWSEAAASGGKFLEPSKIRGRQNPGLPGYTLRLLGIDSHQSNADILAAFLFSCLLGVFWKIKCQSLKSEEEKWSGWLGLTPVIHPLPWWHLYVFAFPLAWIVGRKTFQQKNRTYQFFYMGGVFLLCIATEKVLGEVGIFLEMHAAKTWGVLILTGLVIFTPAQRGALKKQLAR